MPRVSATAADPLPGGLLEHLHLVVVSDLAASRTFYTEILGATVLREGPGLVFADLAGCRIVLSEPGGPTQDKPDTDFVSVEQPTRVSAELILRVADVHRVHEELTRRGAHFLTEPVTFPWETRCYLRDPDGHLIEFTQPPVGAAS